MSVAGGREGWVGNRLDVEEPGKGGMGGMSYGLVVCTRNTSW